MNGKLKVPLGPREDSNSCVSLDGESTEDPYTGLSAQENLVTNPSNNNNMKNRDFATEESQKTIQKNEELPLQPFVSNNHINLDVMMIKATKGIKELDLDAKKSTNNVAKEETITLQPSNKDAQNQHLKLTRKQLKKQRNKLEITNKEAKNLAVIIKRSDGVKVDKELVSIINKRFMEHVLRADKKKVDADKFQFLKSGIVDAGYFLVTAANEQARDWLMSIDLGTYEGAVIRKYRRGKGKKKARKRSKVAKSNSKDVGKESTNIKRQDILSEPCSSGKAFNIQDLETEESYNARIKNQMLLSKQTNSDNSLDIKDFVTEECNNTMTNVVKDKPKFSNSVEGIINKDLGAEESSGTNIKKEN